MTTWVVDASVAVKWAFPGQDDETHQEQALALLTDIQQGKCQVFQPPHWLGRSGSRVDSIGASAINRMLQTFSDDGIAYHHRMGPI
ncbi:MAG: hypothetical protein R3B95_11040 [Nitrospirales bacterium]|nr:hypothetical protein [Nitrospirales bacterium]